MAYKVIEEIWSVSSDDNERRLPSSSERPLFSGGGSSIAYKYAQERASKFAFNGFHEDAEGSYWWGRNDGDWVNHRFVIKPARLVERNGAGKLDASRAARISVFETKVRHSGRG